MSKVLHNNLLALAIFLAAQPGLLSAVQPWTVDAILNMPSAGDPQIRPDGKAFAYVLRNLNGQKWQSIIYTNSIPPGVPKQIGFGSEPRWSPDSSELAYLNGQVTVVNLRTGASRIATHAAMPVTTYRWWKKGRAIAYLSVDPGAAPDPIVEDSGYRFSRLYVQDFAAASSAGPPRKLTRADRHVVSFAFSPDGTKVTYAAQSTPRPRDSFETDLFELDVSTLSEKPLVQQSGSDEAPSYSPDGKFIAFHSQAGSTNYFSDRHVALIPSGGGTIRYLTKQPNVPVDVFAGGRSFSWSTDGGTIFYSAGQRVHNNLVKQDLTNGTIQLIAANIGSSASFTPDLSQAVFLQVSSQQPAEIVLWAKNTIIPLTHFGDAAKVYSPVSAKTVSWKSRDGLPVEGILFLPSAYRPGSRVPLLVELHGGPTGVALEAFPVPRTYPTQAFLESGFAVFAPNFRGSINYGAEFRTKIIESQGYGDFEDVMTGIDYLIEQGIADPARLGVMGWSYGGFLTAWAVGHTKRFKAASIGAPATDWITYYGQSDGPRSTLMTYFGGTPWDHPESYRDHSPRSGLASIETPCLLQIGALDLNYTSEIYWALKDRGVPVESVTYPREPHGFTEPAHQRDVMERNLRWFVRWLAP